MSALNRMAWWIGWGAVLLCGAAGCDDTGMSRGVQSGRGAVLKIEKQHITVLYADATVTRLGAMTGS